MPKHRAVGNFGIIFVPEEERLTPSLATLSRSLTDSEIKERIQIPNPALDREARNMGRLYNNGVDGPLTIDRIEREYGDYGKSINAVEREMTTQSSPENRPKKHNHIVEKGLRINEYLMLEEQQIGGKFYVEPTPDPYENPLMVSKRAYHNVFRMQGAYYRNNSEFNICC
jgi:hypothetical protein